MTDLRLPGRRPGRRRKGPRVTRVHRSASIVLRTPTTDEWRTALWECLSAVQPRRKMVSMLYSDRLFPGVIYDYAFWHQQQHGYAPGEPGEDVRLSRVDAKPWSTTAMAVVTARVDDIKFCAAIAARVTCVHSPSLLWDRKTTMSCLKRLQQSHADAMQVFDWYTARHRGPPSKTAVVPRTRGIDLDD